LVDRLIDSEKQGQTNINKNNKHMKKNKTENGATITQKWALKT